MAKKLDLSILNKEQLEATITVDGPVLVLAGAGSGKTRVLTYRIAYLIAKGLALPSEILAVTFTNKAAGEMKERIAALLNQDEDGAPRQYLPWMGTFHSICVKILRKDGFRLGLEQNFSIYDSADQLDATKEAMKQLNMSTKEFNPRAIHSYISSAKNELIGPKEYADSADGYFQSAVAKVYPKYQEILKENNSVDFDDLLMYTVNLFDKYADVLQEYQTKFKYILVDEYQDTNHAQYKIVTSLAAAHHNICVVGDDDQSIYAFRGATIRNILNFEKDYPNAKIVKLEQNYRSTKTILEAAYEVVSKNKNRSDKKLWTDNADGDKIIVYTAGDEKAEAKWVVNTMQELIRSGTSPLEMAILYRTNSQSRTLEEELLRQALPYKIVGGYRFYERKEIKDVISFLQLLYNPDNDAALARVINVPKRGIGAKTQSDLWAEAAAADYYPFHYLIEFTDKLSHAGLKKFAHMMHDLLAASAEKSVADLINFILERTGYLKSLQDGSTENESRIENLKELLSVAAKYDELEPQAGLRAFLEEVALLEGNPETNEDELQEYVTLMTVHAAKGLEFEHVFLVGMEEGLFPHSRVFNEPKELEEERRLAYVAITRAKHNLYIVHADSRLYFGSRQQNMASRFIEDIPMDYVEVKSRDRSNGGFIDGWDIDFGDDWDLGFEPLEVKKGMKVRHDYFGIGTVIDFNDTIIRIRFGGAFGLKELARDLAQLQLVN